MDYNFYKIDGEYKYKICSVHESEILISKLVKEGIEEAFYQFDDVGTSRWWKVKRIGENSWDYIFTKDVPEEVRLLLILLRG